MLVVMVGTYGVAQPKYNIYQVGAADATTVGQASTAPAILGLAQHVQNPYVKMNRATHATHCPVCTPRDNHP